VSGSADPVGGRSPRRGSAADPGDELVEWVDEGGSLVEVVTRRRMRAENLRHRCTYVVVVVGPRDRFVDTDPAGGPHLQSADEVVVHLRADWKDTSPSHWDLAFGGVCGVGEAWEASARRELAEEAGIELGGGDRLVDLGPVRFDEAPGGVRPPAAIIGRLYLVAWPERPVSTDGEAVAFDRVPLDRLDDWLLSVPVCADSEAVVAPALRALRTGP
jgi:8-oxo-dGTP pyrophosphatase MutT (NUDIX family)